MGIHPINIVMVGTGYVGLVSGACFSEFGFNVVCTDNDMKKISRLQKGEVPIFEPGLHDLVARNMRAGRLRFSTDLTEEVARAQVVFIAVGTPAHLGDGPADLSNVYQAAREIASALKDYTIVVTKSTVPIGTGREIVRIIRDLRPDVEFDVASNPEFLREGSALEDFMRPDRVVIGTDSPRAKEVLEGLYRPLYLIQTPILFTSLESAELTKYAANAFLATKITFINEIADLCERLGADVHDVARGIGLDRRIGLKFLHPGPGYGGSCFPKDTLALALAAHQHGAPMRIVDAIIRINDERKQHIAEKIIKFCGGSVHGKTVGILGLTFKPNTDDMREAPSLTIVPALQTAGAKIRAYDPEGMPKAQKLLKKIAWCRDAYDVAEGADVLVIITEWNVFRALDLDKIKQLMKESVLIDLRNIYSPDEAASAGFRYACVGRSSWGNVFNSLPTVKDAQLCGTIPENNSETQGSVENSRGDDSQEKKEDRHGMIA